MTTRSLRAFAPVCILMLALLMPSFAKAHCEVPCGIYADELRIQAITEDITTIEKASKSIVALSSEGDKNYNQIVRWVVTKEEHAKAIQETVYQYFMTQRIKPKTEADGEAYTKYVTELKLLHTLLVQAMKSKQSTSLEPIEGMREALEAFKVSYLGEHGHSH